MRLNAIHLFALIFKQKLGHISGQNLSSKIKNCLFLNISNYFTLIFKQKVAHFWGKVAHISGYKLSLNIRSFFTLTFEQNVYNI